jgi:hypothetical protein
VENVPEDPLKVAQKDHQKLVKKVPEDPPKLSENVPEDPLKVAQKDP